MIKILKCIFKIVIILLAVIGLGIVALFWFVLKGNNEGDAIADKWIPAIVSEWKIDQLTEHLDPSATLLTMDAKGKESINAGAGRDIKVITQVFDYAKSNFGNMTSYEGAKCKGSLAINCSSTVKFEHGKAHILLLLMKRDGEYKIMGFSIIDSTPLKSGK